MSKEHVFYILKFFILPVVVISILFYGWASYVNIIASKHNRAETVVADFVKNVREYDLNEEIISNNFISNYDNKNNVGILNILLQNNQPVTSEVEYSPSQENAFVDVTFANYPDKKAKIYLEKYGNWYFSGYNWQVYRVEMFDMGTASEVQEQAEGFIQDWTQKIQDTFNSVINYDSQNK